MNTKTDRFKASTMLVVLAGAFICLLPSGLLFAQETAPQDDAKPKTLAQQIVGTWELKEAKSPGSPSGIGSRLKMFTGSHWCVIQPDPATGMVVFQHGGRYALDGDTLKTTRDFAGKSTKTLIGTAGQFKIKIDGDTFKQADSEGVFNETWIRLK